LARLRLEDGDKRVEGNVPGVFGLLLWQEDAFAVTGGQVIDVCLQLTVGFERKNSPRRLGCEAITKWRNETVENGGGFRVLHWYAKLYHAGKWASILPRDAVVVHSEDGTVGSRPHFLAAFSHCSPFASIHTNEDRPIVRFNPPFPFWEEQRWLTLGVW
jgi:hypothetical protein